MREGQVAEDISKYGAEENSEAPEKKKGAEVIEFPKTRENRETQELSEKIKLEQQEATERFGSLISSVSEKYKEMPEATRESYKVHNEEILNGAIELGIKKGFSEEDLKKLELSAVLHDMAKADSVPEKYKDVSNYALAMHAKAAFEEVPNILTDEYLREQNIQGDPEEIRQEVAKAILEHMGPRPGFMVKILDKFNKDMENKGEKGIDYPTAEGNISEALLAADMKSLAGEKGRKKVLLDRFNIKSFADEDKKLVEEYKKYGIDLSQGEAALLSGFDSAENARDMQKDKGNYDWVNESIEASKKVEYDFPGSKEKITWESASGKRSRYEEAKEKAKKDKEDAEKLEEVREKLRAAA